MRSIIRGLSHELRTAARLGRRSATSSVLAIVTLGLAIGASTAIYSNRARACLSISAASRKSAAGDR
jgi:hypothetical protein